MISLATPIWVRLPNLPLQWIQPNLLEEIYNSLCYYIKMDTKPLESGFTALIDICVELDLTKGLPDNIILKWEGNEFSQQLDYKNIAFKFRNYH